MAFLNIQNHELPISYGKAQGSRVMIGEAARALNGTPLTTKRALKRTLAVTTSLVKASYGKFLIALLDGEGHTWNFDDATNWKYSGKGLGPDNVTGASRHTSTTKFGAGALQLNAGVDIAWDVGYDFEWTVMVWKGAAGGGSFPNHIIVNSAGHKYENGVRNDALSTPYISVSGGVLTLGDTGSGIAQYFDDLVIIPADITSEWAADFGVMPNAMAKLPRVRASGEGLHSAVINAECFDTDFSFTGGYIDGNWNSDLMEISFTIQEINRVS